MTRQPGDKLTVRSASATAVLWVLAWCGVWLTCSCSHRSLESFTIGPGSTPKNVYRAADQLPPEMKRVAVLPLMVKPSDSALEAGRQALEPILYAELRKTSRFEAVEVTADQLRVLTGRRQWGAEEKLPPDFLKQLQTVTGCDAVLFSRLTQYRAYPPLVIGWDLRLVDVKTASVFWAVDEVFDASNEPVNNAARLYLLKQMPETSTPVDSRTILNSPRRFGQFSASQAVATLPDRMSLLAKVPPQPADKQTEMRKP